MELDFSIENKGVDLDFNIDNTKVVNTGGGISETKVREIVKEETVNLQPIVDNDLETTSKKIVGAINEVNAKWQSSGSSVDVQIAGTSIVENGVANIPLATDKVAGVVKPSYGLRQINGALGGTTRTYDQLEKENDNYVVAKGALKNTVLNYFRDGVKNNALTLSDEEKTTACTWLGAIQKGTSTNILRENGTTTPTTYNGSANSIPMTNGQGNIYGRLKDDDGINHQDILTPKSYVDGLIESIKSESGSSIDVQINGASIVQDGVANIPIASNTTTGVLKVNKGYGFTIDTSGNQKDMLRLTFATEQSIDTRHTYYVMNPNKMDYAVKSVLTANKITLEETDQAKAKEWLGVKTIYKHEIALVVGFFSVISALVFSSNNTSMTKEDIKNSTTLFNEINQQLGYHGVLFGETMEIKFASLGYDELEERLIIYEARNGSVERYSSYGEEAEIYDIVTEL